MDAALGYAAERWEAELEMGREPGVLEREPGLAHLGEHVLEVLLDEMRQHEAVVQLRAPARQFLDVRGLPEAGDQTAEQQLLHQAHAGVRRHLERAQPSRPRRSPLASGA